VFRDHEYNFSANNNFLAKKAQGEVLLFMNNDVFFTYDAVSEMVKHINCSNIGCLGHRLVFDRDKNIIQHDGQILYQPWDGKWNGPGHYNLNRNINEIDSKNVKVEGLTAAFLMIRKRIFNKVQGFDEDYKDIFQDVDLNLKVSMLGYDNYCIREKALIHVDHATRVGDATPDSPADFRKYHTDWVSKGAYPIKAKKKYSILVCATNIKQIKALFKSIQSSVAYEFIYVNNKSNLLWSAEALNLLTDVSEGDYLYWMHQDVTFDKSEPFVEIDNIVRRVDGKFGVIGPAGIQVGGKGSIRGVDFSSLKYTFDFLRCQTLDEFCLISKRENNLRFDEDVLDDFHFYGTDICLQAQQKKLQNYVIKFPITHHSGGDVNLKKKGGYESYQKSGRKVFKKWKDKYPFISTTTVHYRKGQIHWYLGNMLGLHPNFEEIDFDKINETTNVKKYLTEEEITVDKYLKEKEDGVSIVILNKDAPELIKRCVDEIAFHTQQKNYEILIGDTGTTNEETLEYYNDLPDIARIIDAGEYHFSKNNNDVAKEAKYNKVLFLNNDVFIESDVLEYMSSQINKNIGIVGLKLLYEDGKVQHAGVEMVISKERNPDEWYLPEHIDYKEENTDKEDEIVDCVTGACLMMPTDLFLEYNGFGEEFEQVFQDVDLCLRMNRLGFKSFICNKHKATHLESATRNPEINPKDYYTMTGRWGRIKY
jgi:GT2 family glycosyltransferase